MCEHRFNVVHARIGRSAPRGQPLMGGSRSRSVMAADSKGSVRMQLRSHFRITASGDSHLHAEQRALGADRTVSNSPFAQNPSRPAVSPGERCARSSRLGGAPNRPSTACRSRRTHPASASEHGAVKGFEHAPLDLGQHAQYGVDDSAPRLAALGRGTSMKHSPIEKCRPRAGAAASEASAPMLGRGSMTGRFTGVGGGAGADEQSPGVPTPEVHHRRGLAAATT